VLDVTESATGSSVFVGELIVNRSAQAAQVIFDPYGCRPKDRSGRLESHSDGRSKLHDQVSGLEAPSGSTFSVAAAHTRSSIMGVGRF